MQAELCYCYIEVITQFFGVIACTHFLCFLNLLKAAKSLFKSQPHICAACWRRTLFLRSLSAVIVTKSKKNIVKEDFFKDIFEL